MHRILLICRDGEELRRIATFAERRGVSVLRANTPDSAVNMIGLVMLDAVFVDAADEPIVPRIRRNHPNADVVCLADHLGVETDADRILRSPVDLFVLDRLLDRLGAPVTADTPDRAEGEMAEQASRERRRVHVSD